VLPLFAADPAASHWVWTALGLLSIPLLVALNGFFVAAEFALVAVRATRVEELVRQGVSRAVAVQAAIANLDRSIAATQLGITLASIALGWVGEATLARLIEPWFAFLPDPLPFITRHGLAVAVAFTLVTFMHVVFGELMPKAIALQTPDTTSLWVSPPLNLFARVSRPVVHVMNGTANWLIRRLGYQPSGETDEVHSVEELRMLIEDTEEAGLLEPQQADVVLNVFALANKKVRDVMVPWDKVAALDVSASPGDVMTTVRNGAHTRLPVYDGDKNKIVGVVNTKDLFYLFSTSGVVSLIDAVYEPVFLDANESVSVALDLFRKAHRHLAIVREEDGTVVGILTLEDVLEEIVGEIEDEHDIDVPKLRRAVAQQLLLRRRAEAARPVLTRGPAASDGAPDP
jgi:putative hemolysin